jgi:hypothetical protein
MKKLLSLSPAKIFIACGLGLIMTLGAFWHHQVNQSQLDRIGLLSQGVSTCFNRISQTFTAMMIKDIQSPYLNRGFMALSDECLSETVKGINPFRKNVGKGHETLNQLVSEVHWFHEKILKIHTPMVVGQNLTESLAPISDKYSKMEELKVTLVDEIDSSSARLREVQSSDEFLMGTGLLIFVVSLSLLSLQEFNRIQLRREIEREAINHLKAGQASMGAFVDKLVDRALASQGMPVTAQIFRDYHGDIMERGSRFTAPRSPKQYAPKTETPVAAAESKNEADHVPAFEAATVEMPKASLKEVLVSIQSVQAKETMHLSEVRDVVLAVENESLEMLMNAAINKLASSRPEGKKIMISNQIHSDRSIINFFLAGATFNASELEFFSAADAVGAEGIDMNLVLLKEMINEAGIQWNLENKADRQGRITGMNIRLVVNRVPKENKSKLVSVVRGKKKDISRELMN